MQKKRLNLHIATTMMLSATLLTGCFGGGSSSSSTPTIAQGQFIDAPVAGVDVYQNGKLVATTDAEGKYKYTTGSAVTFKVGELTLGTASAKAIITPADLSSDTAVVTKVLQVLQSLDSDNNPANGIVIEKTTAEKFKTVVNLVDATATVETVLKDVVATDKIVTAENALKHFATSNEYIKNSTELVTMANRFAGYWQTGCEVSNDNTTSRVETYQLVKVAGENNKLQFAPQSKLYTFDNTTCSGQPVSEATVQDNQIVLTILGVKKNDKGNEVVHVMEKFDNNSQKFHAVTWQTKDLFEVEGDTQSRLTSLSLNTQVNKPTNASDAQVIEDAVNTLVGYWQMECRTYSQDYSETYYLQAHKINGTTINIPKGIDVSYKSPNCSGNPTEIKIEEFDELQTLKNPTFTNGKWSFDTSETSNGDKLTIDSQNGFTVGQEYYFRTSATTFNQAVANATAYKQKLSTLQGSVTEAVANGFVKSYIPTLDSIGEGYIGGSRNDGDTDYRFSIVLGTNRVEIYETTGFYPNYTKTFITSVNYERKTVNGYQVLTFNIPTVVKNKLDAPYTTKVFVQTNTGTIETVVY